MSDATTPDDPAQLDGWRIGAHARMSPRKDNKSDGLYASLSDDDILAPFEGGDRVRAAAWNQDGDRVSWFARVHKSGNCIAIPEQQRRHLDLEPHDEILWGVAPTAAEPIESADGTVSPWDFDSGVGSADSPTEGRSQVANNNRQHNPDIEQSRLPVDSQDERDALEASIREELSHARFADGLEWVELAGVLEDILADVAEQSRFND